MRPQPDRRSRRRLEALVRYRNPNRRSQSLDASAEGQPAPGRATTPGGCLSQRSKSHGRTKTVEDGRVCSSPPVMLRPSFPPQRLTRRSVSSTVLVPDRVRTSRSMVICCGSCSSIDAAYRDRRHGVDPRVGAGEITYSRDTRVHRYHSTRGRAIVGPVEGPRHRTDRATRIHDGIP